MSFGYTVLGFGSGVADAAPVPIAEDLTFSLEQITSAKAGNFEMKIDPFNANKCLLAWQDADNDYRIAAATISEDGNTFTLGSEVEIGTIYGQNGIIAFDPSTENSFIVCWQNYASGSAPGAIYHAAVAGTLSGTTITVGSTTNISNVEAQDYIGTTTCIFNPNRAGQVITAHTNYDNATTSAALETQTLTVSGTTITQVNNYDVDTTTQNYEVSICWDGDTTSDQFYIAYRNGSDNHFVVPCTVDASNVITIGTINQHSTSAGRWSYNDIIADPNTPGRIVVVYLKGSQTTAHTKVGNLSGGTITWGTAIEFTSALSWGTFFGFVRVSMDKETADKCLITFNSELADNKMRAVVGTLSSTDTISVGTEVVVYADFKPGMQSLNNDPHNPGRFWSPITAASDYGWVIGHQIASFE